MVDHIAGQYSNIIMEAVAHFKGYQTAAGVLPTAFTYLNTEDDGKGEYKEDFFRAETSRLGIHRSHGS